MNRILFLAGLLLLSCQKKTPKISILKEYLNLGEVNKGDTTISIFKILNSGNAPLQIKNAKGSCECVSVDWDLDEINANDTSLVKIKYVPSNAGAAKQTIVIETNASPPFSALSFEATVKE